MQFRWHSRYCGEGFETITDRMSVLSPHGWVHGVSRNLLRDPCPNPQNPDQTARYKIPGSHRTISNKSAAPASPSEDPKNKIPFGFNDAWIFCKI